MGMIALRDRLKKIKMEKSEVGSVFGSHYLKYFLQAPKYISSVCSSRR
jgi:hypothetical protein